MTTTWETTLAELEVKKAEKLAARAARYDELNKRSKESLLQEAQRARRVNCFNSRTPKTELIYDLLDHELNTAGIRGGEESWHHGAALPSPQQSKN